MAYLRVGSFDVPTGKAIREAIEQLGGPKLKGLVLDLRNNPGGVVSVRLWKRLRPVPAAWSDDR